MKFSVDPKIFQLFPELRLGVVIAEEIHNAGTDDQVQELLRKAESDINKKLEIEFLSKNEFIKNWKTAYKLLKIMDGRPSHEALIRRSLKGNEIPHINKLVDIYNYLSLEFMTPFGGEDLSKIKGNLQLRFAQGTEDFVELGSNDVTHPNPDEVIYSDEEKVLCRKFNWRESELTKLTDSTRNAFFVSETLPPFPEKVLDTLLEKFADALSRFCGAKATTYKIDSKNTEIQW